VKFLSIKLPPTTHRHPLQLAQGCRKRVIGIGGRIVVAEGTGCWRRWRLPSGATRTATDTSQDRIPHVQRND